jgi:soluble lytic murein transglycosylase-like protein
MAELKRWMARYADLPEASAIYNLAKQGGSRHAAGIKPPAHDAAQSAAADSDDGPGWEDFTGESTRQLTAADSRLVHDFKSRFRRAVHQGRIESAAAMLDGPEVVRVFDKVDYDELKTVLGMAHFAEGRDAEAARWAVDAAERSGDVLPESHWVAGLALWRGGDRAASLRHFEAVGNATDVSSWLIAAGSYWAARANLTLRHPQLVSHWLQKAAAYPRTFYGLLARRALGQDVQYSWEARPFTDADAEILLHVPGARRALGLIQLGDKERAEEELLRLATAAAPALAQSMLSLAYTSDMPAAAVRLGERVSASDGRSHDSADYPLPDWRPANGWTVDRALVLAIARQESSFNPEARSSSGAVGLMQLMPQTARSMGAGRLTNPEVNLELGQRYVRHLLDDDSIRGNLLLLAASYNSGPGAVARWLQTIHHQGDPLLFLESIPVRETRVFVQQVMTNYWAYRNRLGQTYSSLDAIAGGDWPMYEGAGMKAAKYVRNR